MTIYFFDIYNDAITLDDEGAELADGEAAKAHAIKAARSLASTTVMHGYLAREHRIDIRDSDHNTIGSVRFDEAVEIRQQ